MHITRPWDNDSEGDKPHEFEFFENNISEFKAVAKLQESEPFCQKLNKELECFWKLANMWMQMMIWLVWNFRDTNFL